MVEKTELEFIFNSTQDAMFMAEYIGGEFHYIRINSAHQKMSGFNNSNIKGKTPIEVWGKETGEKLHNFYLQGMLSTDGMTVEEAVAVGGKTHVFMTRLMPAGNNGRKYLIVSRTDITQLKELQEENIVLSRRLQAMFSDHSAVMLVIDPETGRILNANPSACVFYGYDMSELLSLNVQDINMLPKEETARLRKRLWNGKKSILFSS